jgi:hypothetical protein
MPFKANAGHRHHIPKQKRIVTNWATYNASLRQRGNLTVPLHLLMHSTGLKLCGAGERPFVSRNAA